MIRAKGSLRKRITLITVLGISIILLGLGVASRSIIKKDIDESLDRKLALSRLIRNNVDTIIRENINRLYDISLSGVVDLDDGDFGPEKEAVKRAYRYSIFTDGIFLVDRRGKVLVDYPERIRESAPPALNSEPVIRRLSLGKPVVSDLCTVKSSGKKMLYMLVPLRDRNGRAAGIAGGRIDPTNPVLTQKLGLIDLGKNEFIDVVDSNGIVLASSEPARMFTQCNRNNFFTTVISRREERVATCHVCHVAGGEERRQATILAFVPLETAPWGISIQEPRADVFAPAMKLKTTFIVLGVVFMGTALILTIGINLSIVAPLKDLIRGVERITKGDLSKPVAPQGSDEIGVLSRSFETMRMKLVESLDRITHQNLDLENRVRIRTHQIKEGQKKTKFLLKKVITSQEDERKRIARELHDSALQDLSAALMQIDMCKLHPEKITGDKIDKIRDIVLGAWDGVIGIIRNLRPSLLDDLGLTAATQSLLDTHLGNKGIQYTLNTEGVRDTRFRPAVEITIFRIIQEAISNIAHHARAGNVAVRFTIEDNAVLVDIEDNGEGFDPEALLHQGDHDLKDRRGLGLLGMKERAGLLGGTLEIRSQPGGGTKIHLKIPLTTPEVLNA